MLKTFIKTGVAAALGWTGADHAIGSWTGSKTLPLVLGYHAVVEDFSAHIGRAILPSLISIDMLERHLDWIGRRYRFIGLDELGAQMESGEPFAYPTAAVTFDDGYAGVYHHALPLLQRKGIPAGMFVVTESIGRTQLQIYDKLYLLLSHVLPALRYSESRFLELFDGTPIGLRQRVRLGPMRDMMGLMRQLFTTLPQHTLRRVVAALETVSHIEDKEFPDLHALDWEMVTALDRSGMIIGSHTQTHVLLTIEKPSLIANQLTESARTLELKLGKPVTHFAYPDGRFNSEVVAAVAQAGYRWAYTTCSHRDPVHPSLTIPRTLLWENDSLDIFGRFSSNLMSYHASGVVRWLAPCLQRHDFEDRGVQLSSTQPAVNASNADSEGVARRSMFI